MTVWASLAFEERNLLNPAFCSILLWQAASGYAGSSRADVAAGIPFELGFLVLPMVLHRETRETLPRTTATTMAVWLDSYPLARTHIASRAMAMVPFTKEAMAFGGLHGFLHFPSASVIAVPRWKRKVSGVLRNSSDEVARCGSRAEFLGKWFARSGDAATVLAMMGLKP